MVNWGAASVAADDWADSKVIVVFCLGLYGWEFLQTLWFEWALMTRYLPFKWPYVPYFLGRYCLICVLCSLVSVNETTTRINCNAAFKVFSFLMVISIGCASTNLLIRTMIIWRRERIVVATLLLFSLGHWTTLFIAGARNAEGHWNSSMSSCIFNYSSNREMASLYLYTMLFDLLILVVTAVGLARERSRSLLWITLYRQGILYFVVAFVANVIPCVLAWINLNAVMAIIFSTPAACASTIASSRNVTWLLQSGDLKSESSQADGGTPGINYDQIRHRFRGPIWFRLWARQIPVPETNEDIGQLSTRLSIPPASTDHSLTMA